MSTAQSPPPPLLPSLPPAARRPLLLLLGDSLTQNGTDANSSGWICLLQHRYNRSTDVVARGLSGYNTKWFILHALPTLEQEMRSGRTSPSLVTLWLGANDAALVDGYAANQHVPLADYRENLRTILTALKKAAPADCEFLFITPPHVDDATRASRVTSGSLDRSNESAGKYARACVEEARSAGIEALDLHSFFNAMSEQERTACLSDGLHFSAKGNRLVDEQLRGKIADTFPDLAARLEVWQAPNWRDLELADC